MRSILLGMTLLLAGIGAAVADSVLSSVTHLDYDRTHGTQVEFIDLDGMSYHWYAGSRVVIKARWKATDGPNGEMCYLYCKDTVSPVTNNPGGEWECQPIASYRANVVHKTLGDPFDLRRRRTVPFVLARERTTLPKIYEHYQKVAQ